MKKFALLICSLLAVFAWHPPTASAADKAFDELDVYIALKVYGSIDFNGGMSTVDRDAESYSNGTYLFNSDTGRFQFREAGNWISFLSNRLEDYTELSTPAAGDYITYFDTSDSNEPKRALVSTLSGSSSLTGDDSIDITSDVITLLNDEDAPGNSNYYGTDGSGSKGWHSLPSGVTFEGLTDTPSYTGNALKLLRVNATTDGVEYISPDYADDSINLTAGAGLTGGGDLSANRTFTVSTKNSVEIDSDSLQLDGDTASPGNTKLYGTNGSGVKGWYDQPSDAGDTDIDGLLAVTDVAADDYIPLWDESASGNRKATAGVLAREAIAESSLSVPDFDESSIGFQNSATSTLLKATPENVLKSVFFGSGAATLTDAVISDKLMVFDAGASEVKVGSIETVIHGYLTPQTLTDAATITYDVDNGVSAIVTLGGDRTLDEIADAVAGQTGVLTVIQDGTGGRSLTLDASQADMTGNIGDIGDMAAGEVAKIAWETHDGTAFHFYTTIAP